MAHQDARFVEYGRTYRPRVSRETRRLLLTASVSLVVLWALAQARFPDRPAPANPVQPLLTQITQPATLDDLAAEVARAQARIDPFLVALHAPALRFRDDLALVTTAVAADYPVVAPTELITYDIEQSLALVRLPGVTLTRPPAWAFQRPERPRYLLAADTFGTTLNVRPVFVSGLQAVTTPVWPGEVWMLPPRIDVAPGSWLFTTGGETVGMATAVGDRVAVVPTALVIAEAERLFTQDVLQAGLTPP
jgi:hypothetical protein